MSQQSSGLEVLLVPGHPLLGRVSAGDRVVLLSGGALLGRLEPRGALTVGDLADRGEVLGGSATLEGSYSE